MRMPDYTRTAVQYREDTYRDTIATPDSDEYAAMLRRAMTCPDDCTCRGTRDAVTR